jgi:hypothetical protein
VTAGFAGFTCHSRLSVDPFGELWAATGPGGKHAQLRRIDARLAHLRPFASTLLKNGERLAGIEHPNLVGTIAVGHDDDDALVLVQADHGEQVSLETVLKDARLSGVHASAAVALYIVRQVVKALARVHRAGSPRRCPPAQRAHRQARRGPPRRHRGGARARRRAASDDSLLQGLLGYLAPEIALGDEPGPRSDVFSAGALLTELCTGAPAPGLLEGRPRSSTRPRAPCTPTPTSASPTPPSCRWRSTARPRSSSRIPTRARWSASSPSRTAAPTARSTPRPRTCSPGWTSSPMSRLEIGMHEVEPSQVRGGFETGRDHTPLPPPVPLGRDETGPPTAGCRSRGQRLGGRAHARPRRVAARRGRDADGQAQARLGADARADRRRDLRAIRDSRAHAAISLTPAPCPRRVRRPRPCRSRHALGAHAQPHRRDHDGAAGAHEPSRLAVVGGGAPRSSGSAPFAAIPPSPS